MVVYVCSNVHYITILFFQCYVYNNHMLEMAEYTVDHVKNSIHIFGTIIIGITLDLNGHD